MRCVSMSHRNVTSGHFDYMPMRRCARRPKDLDYDDRLFLGAAMERVLSMWWVALALSVATMVAAVGPIVDLKITKAQQDLLSIQAAVGLYNAKRGTSTTGLARLSACR